ncbi:MAG: hypothetical protein D6706_22215 [Chloroflexi bacterium]|nr:MAG: hypothetical protein D6706_22215 [Chloroflexota bacterium]
MKPIVHELEAKYGNQIEFVYLNIDDPETNDEKLKYGFRYQPHFILLDENGEIVEQWLGSVPQTTFEEAFAQILNN